MRSGVVSEIGVPFLFSFVFVSRGISCLVSWIVMGPRRLMCLPTLRNFRRLLRFVFL